MDHVEALANSQRHQRIAGIREGLHRWASDFAYVEVSQNSITER